MFGILIAEWTAFLRAVMQMAFIANVVFVAQKDLILVPLALGLILQLEAPVERVPSLLSQQHRMSGTLSVVGAATARDASLMVFIASAGSATTMITFLAPRKMLRARICVDLTELARKQLTVTVTVLFAAIAFAKRQNSKSLEKQTDRKA